MNIGAIIIAVLVGIVFILAIIRVYIVEKRDIKYRKALKFTHDEWERAQILTKRFNKMQKEMLWKH